MQGDWRGSEACRIGVGTRAVARSRQPPFLQGLPRIVPHVSETVVAEGESLEKGHDDRLLLGGQRGEAPRVPIGWTERADQGVHGHRRIVRTAESVADESREIVPP
jgi:hypothetical protein